MKLKFANFFQFTVILWFLLTERITIRLQVWNLKKLNKKKGQWK